jgi:hypothetical protein
MFNTKLTTLKNFFDKHIAPVLFMKVGGFIIASFVVSLIGTAVAIKGSMDAAEAQKEAAKKAQAHENIKAQKSREEAVRERRGRAAALANTAAQTGVSSSSGVAGGQISLGSQLGSNVATQNTDTAFGKAIGEDMQTAADAKTMSALGGSLASTANSYGAKEGAKKVFG